MKSDTVIITDIYQAREKPIKGIDSKLIINELLRLGHQEVSYIGKLLSLPSFIKKMELRDHIVLVMGAGNIWRICNNIYEEIK